MGHPPLVLFVSGLVGLTACDVVLGFDPIPDAATVDAMTCEMPSVFDGFDGATACGAWGYVGGNTAVVTQTDGRLLIEPSVTGGNGNCLTRNPAAFGPSGMFIEVSEVLPQDISYMFLQVTWTDAAGPHDYAMTLQRDGLAFQEATDTIVLGQVGFDLVRHRWWRIRPGADQLISETSPDGHTWSRVGVSGPLTIPAAVTVDIHAGNFAASAQPGRAAFDSFNLCPSAT